MPKRNIIWIVAIAAAAVLAFYLARHRRGRPGRPAPNELQPASRAYRLIREKYDGPIRDGALHRGAIGGMISALDEFSSYVPPGKAETLRRHMKGVDCGVGLRLEKAAGRVKVVGPLARSPAHRAGIAAGDEILAVDAQPVAPLSLQRVYQLLDGRVGATVVLTVLRGRGRPRKVELTRGAFPLETVEGFCRDREGRWVYRVQSGGRIGYIRIREFTDVTAGQFRQAYRELTDIKALVLDLRDNPGGPLPAAVKVANMFLPEGIIVISISRGGPPRPYHAHAEGTYPQLPMVALINGRTASAPEIVAGALQIHDRALLVGSPTRGKRCVQSMIPLGSEWGQMNLTTSHWYLADDLPGCGRGDRRSWALQPDVAVGMSLDNLRRLRRLWVACGTIRPPAATRPAGLPRSGPREDLAGRMLEHDSHLAKAVDLLTRPTWFRRVLRRAAARRARLKADPRPAGGTGRDHD